MRSINWKKTYVGRKIRMLLLFWPFTTMAVVMLTVILLLLFWTLVS